MSLSTPNQTPATAPTVSFEFFPPKTDEADEAFRETVTRLKGLNPAFLSVTYGAGGTTRERTWNLVKMLHEEFHMPVAAHLTCVGDSRDEIDQLAHQYWDLGIRHIVALRGDPPADTGPYRPRSDGYAYAADLVTGLRSVADFEISVGAYPETHPDASSPEADLDNLKRKIDAGAHRAITQYFFEPEFYLRFRDRAVARGINVPIIPGIMTVTNFVQIKRFSNMCGASIPSWMEQRFAGLEEDVETRKLTGTLIAWNLVETLRREGVDQFHFYTLNRLNPVFSLANHLNAQG